jgi:hypothetical protein
MAGITIFAYSDFYRPYFIEDRELKNIIFFDKKGVVVESGNGWLNGLGGKDLYGFKLDKHPIQKRVTAFEKMYAENQPFCINVPIKSRYETKGDVLYVPYVPSEWEITNKTSDYHAHRSFYKIYTNKKQPFRIQKLDRVEDIQENVSFIEKVKEIGKLMVICESDLCDGEILNNREEIIKKINEIAISLNTPTNKNTEKKNRFAEIDLVEQV